MRGSLDTDDLWKEERPAIEQEVAQDLSNPQYVFYTQLLEAMFQGTPYAHDALGSRPSFDKTTGQMLHQFYDTWYAPNNAIFVIAGDVQPEHVLAEVKALFGDIPKKTLPAKPAGKPGSGEGQGAGASHRPSLRAGGGFLPHAGLE